MKRRTTASRRGGGLAVLGALLASAAGCTSAAPSATSPGPGDTVSASAPGTGASVSALVRALPRGQTGTRAQVPWSLVGPGWTLVDYARTAQLASPPQAGPVTIYLVDPAGGKYEIYRWASVTPVSDGLPESGILPGLLDWSGDKRRALITLPDRGGLAQLSLASGEITRISTPSATGVNGYTKPDGLALLASRAQSGATILERLTLAGAPEQVLARMAAGQVNQPLESADGTEIVISGTGGLRLVANSGGLIRHLPVTGGSCEPVRWWDASTVLAQCGAASWLVPTNGSAPSQPPAFTAAARASTAGPILSDPWQVGSGYYFQKWVTGCSGQIYQVSASGSLRPVTVAGANIGPRILALRDGRFLIWGSTACDTDGAFYGALLWLDPRSGAEQVLIPNPPGKDGVVGAVPYHSTLALQP